MSGAFTYLSIVSQKAGFDGSNEAAYRIDRLEALEQLSRPFSYTVDVLASLDAPADLIDSPVTVILGDPETGGRYLNGIVRAVRQQPEIGASLWRYQLMLVPKLWFLQQTRACRFFQSMTVPEIVEKILGEFDITFSNVLQNSYLTRDYTVMFNESYLTFIQRLLEDEGIFYFFTHTKEAHTLVLGDFKTAFVATTSGEATLRHAQGSEDLNSWEQEDLSTLGEVTVDDYNPRTDDLSLGALRGQLPGTSTATGASTRTHYAWPALRVDANGAAAKAKWRIEAAEAASQLFSGSGGAMDFFAGGKFKLNNDPTIAGNAADSTYVLRGVSYKVTQSGVQMDCTAFLAATQWREEPAFPPPVMAGLYSAKVIGQGEIYTDDLGRIKVWFPWDMKSEITSDATLWVRVMQPWAGVGWGHQFIPRVGMEVVVAFLEGDVNRPCVVGTLYNNQNTPLFAPADKNKSGIRTRSTEGGGAANYNELSFDDTAGSEVFLIHAEKDHTIEVENDRTLTVGGKRSDTITGDHGETIKQGNHATKVSQGNRTTEISLGNESVKVDMGTITHEAMQSITLKVGQNSIVIDQTGITLKGLLIQATGQTMATLKGPIVEVNGSGMLTLAGGITMIN
jgi:type VI secretion system secreted protein VgrG